ncbi:hypothetical protein EVAR_14861_1 [Eumeta japonica]|uniref:Uncharacterized protein n=1 Tax=Eumeta variegata TaxID=151549 RepID=A0A4C1V3R2_EUMVA|nr:hypothetical protein EVAR_14861_1 [Eumeta japonica]
MQAYAAIARIVVTVTLILTKYLLVELRVSSTTSKRTHAFAHRRRLGHAIDCKSHRKTEGQEARHHARVFSQERKSKTTVSLDDRGVSACTLKTRRQKGSSRTEIPQVIWARTEGKKRLM